VVGAEVEEEDLVVEVVAEEAAGEEVAANQQQQWQQHQQTRLEMDLKEYHPLYFEETPNYSTRSNKSGDYTEPPTSITMI
jgi:hypothetical protein